ncbi:GntR family transcriptional regulator [Wenxinia saemankumensis]|nr:GntR family transcriptional regulator [Wenxinia saemankumensis]
MSLPPLPDHIAAELRRKILRGDLRPGQSVKERDHAAEMGVSRTPMREAIRILAKEGLIELRPARSPVVARPDLRELCDSAEVLIALERLSGELACRNASDAGLARIASAAQRMEDGFATAERIDSFEMDMAFHMAIAVESGNAALARTHRAYLARLWRARFLASRLKERRQLALEQHGQMVAALVARDVGAFTAVLGDHLAGLPDYFRLVLAGEAAEAGAETSKDGGRRPGKDEDETAALRGEGIGEAGTSG